METVAPDSQVSESPLRAPPEWCVGEILRWIVPAGELKNHEEMLQNTPGRVVKALYELTRGYQEDPSKILNARFEAGKYDEIVALAGIHFYSTCEHHLLPFFGTVDLAYIPNGHVVGVSKLARLVETFSHRLQLQERMTSEIAEALERHLQPKGVAVVVRGQHLCMMARGVRKEEATMVTSEMRGGFRENVATRNEVLGLFRDGR
jgi:GTP cyclohydrolase IA